MKITKLHGFEIIQKRKSIIIKDANGLWSISYKENTRAYNVIKHFIEQDHHENLKRLISALWAVDIMLIDDVCLKNINKAIINTKEIPNVGGFVFKYRKKHVKISTKARTWDANFSIGTMWHGSIGFHLRSDIDNANLLALIYYMTSVLVFTNIDFLKQLEKIIIKSHGRFSKSRLELMTKDEEQLYFRVEDYINNKNNGKGSRISTL